MWSGTPLNIITALEADDWEVDCLDASQIYPLAFRAEGAAGKNRFQLLWSALTAIPRKRRYGNALSNYLKRNKQPGPILHLYGPGYLPLRGLPAPWKQYLVLDSTGHTWGMYTHFQSSALQRFASRIQQRSIYRGMDHLFPISQFVREDLIRYYGIQADRITAIGTGMGIIRPFNGEKDYGNGLILTAAKERFVEKGAGLLLAGFQLARRQLPHLKLVIVGKHEVYPETGDAHIHTTGFLPVEELQSLFEQAALFAMPANHEPWGLVYLEALSTRTPILGLNRCAFPEICAQGEAGFIVNEPTPQAVADALVSAMGTPGRLAQMGAIGQRYVSEKYGWDKVAIRLAEVINSR